MTAISQMSLPGCEQAKSTECAPGEPCDWMMTSSEISRLDYLELAHKGLKEGSSLEVQRTEPWLVIRWRQRPPLAEGVGGGE